MSHANYRAGEDDVRQYLHMDDWDPAAIPTETVLQYIDDANLLVDEELADTGQSERRLTKLEALIAAHYMITSNIDDLRQSSRDSSADGSATTYAGGPQTSRAFEESTLGRRAIAEDRSGRLKQLVEGDGEFWHVTRF